MNNSFSILSHLEYVFGAMIIKAGQMQNAVNHV